jgi:BMFP domain-containing protein YqiC
MLNAWSDIELPSVPSFVTNPPNKANALFWCFILHLKGEFRAFFGFKPLFWHFYPYNLKYKCVSFLQLSIELRISIMQKPGEILEQIQRIANDMQNKVGDAIRNSPAQEIEKNVRAMMNQGFQKMDLVTREEFELQSKVLAKTREKLELLEAKVVALEKSQ